MMVTSLLIELGPYLPLVGMSHCSLVTALVEVSQGALVRKSHPPFFFFCRDRRPEISNKWRGVNDIGLRRGIIVQSYLIVKAGGWNPVRGASVKKVKLGS